MEDYGSFTEAELMLLLNRKDKNAFKEVYVRFSAELFLHAMKVLGEREQAADVVHDVFVGIYRNIGKLDTDKPLGLLLHRCVKNTIINLIRHDKVKKNYLLYLQLRDLRGPAPDTILAEKALQRQIDVEIKKMPPKMQEALNLRRNDDLSYRQIAKKTSTSEETVKKHIHLALKILRAKLASFF